MLFISDVDKANTTLLCILHAHDYSILTIVEGDLQCLVLAIVLFRM